MFTFEDLHQVTFSVYLERRLIRYLQTFRTALTQLYYNRNSLSRRLRNFGQSIFGFTPQVKQLDRPPPLPVDCVLKGMGLIVAVQERRSSFYIYFLQPQHSHLLRIQHQHYDSEPADIAVFIRGPHGDYGEVIIQYLNPNKSSNYKSLTFSATKSACNIPINYRLTTRYIRVNYMPQNHGTHELAVLRRGYHLPGSPFLVTVDMRSQYAMPQTYGFSDDEECSKNKSNRRRLRVRFRVVDFVTEKMLLTEDGRLEKLPVLMSERILSYKTSQTSSDRTCSSPESIDSCDEHIQRLKHVTDRQPSTNPSVFKTSPTKKPKIGKDYTNLLRGRWRKVMLLCRFFAKHSSDQRRLHILRAAGHIFDGRPVRLTESTLKLIEEAVSAMPNEKDDFTCQTPTDEINNESSLESDVNSTTNPPQYEICTTVNDNDKEISDQTSNLDVSSLGPSSEVLEETKTLISENTAQDQSMEALRELYKSTSNVGLNLIAHLEDEKDKGAITTRRIACSQYRKDAISILGKVAATEFEGMNPTTIEVPIINSVGAAICGDQISNTAKDEKTNGTPNIMDSTNYASNKTEKRSLRDVNDNCNATSPFPEVTLIANEEASVSRHTLEVELRLFPGETEGDSNRGEHLEHEHTAQLQNKSKMKKRTGNAEQICNEYSAFDIAKVSTDIRQEDKYNKSDIPSISEDQCHEEPKEMLYNANLSQKNLKTLSDNRKKPRLPPDREETPQCRECLEIIGDAESKYYSSKDTALSFSDFPKDCIHEIKSENAAAHCHVLKNNEAKEPVTNRDPNTSKEKVNMLQKQSKIQTECPPAAVKAMIMRFESLQNDTPNDLIEEKTDMYIASQATSMDNEELQDTLTNEREVSNNEEGIKAKENRQPPIKPMKELHQCNAQDTDQRLDRQTPKAAPSYLGNQAKTNPTQKTNSADLNVLKSEEKEDESLTCNAPAQLTANISSLGTGEEGCKVVEDSQLEHVQDPQFQEKCCKTALAESIKLAFLCLPNECVPDNNNARNSTFSEGDTCPTALVNSADMPCDSEIHQSREEVVYHAQDNLQHTTAQSVTEDKSTLKNEHNNSVHVLEETLEQQSTETTKTFLMDISNSIQLVEIPLISNDLPGANTFEKQLVNLKVQTNDLENASPPVSSFFGSSDGSKKVNSTVNSSDVTISKEHSVCSLKTKTELKTAATNHPCSVRQEKASINSTYAAHDPMNAEELEDENSLLKTVACAVSVIQKDIEGEGLPPSKAPSVTYDASSLHKPATGVSLFPTTDGDEEIKKLKQPTKPPRGIDVQYLVSGATTDVEDTEIMKEARVEPSSNVSIEPNKTDLSEEKSEGSKYDSMRNVHQCTPVIEEGSSSSLFVTADSLQGNIAPDKKDTAIKTITSDFKIRESAIVISVNDIEEQAPNLQESIEKYSLLNNSNKRFEDPTMHNKASGITAATCQEMSSITSVESSGPAKEGDTQCNAHFMAEVNEFSIDFLNNDIQDIPVTLKETEIPAAPRVSLDSLEKFPTMFMESDAEYSRRMSDIDNYDGLSTNREQVIHSATVNKEDDKILKELDCETSAESQKECSAITKTHMETFSVSKELPEASTRDKEVNSLLKRSVPIPEVQMQFYTSTRPDQLEETSSDGLFPRTTITNLKDGIEALTEENLTHSTFSFSEPTERKILPRTENKEPLSVDTENDCMPRKTNSYICASRHAEAAKEVPYLKSSLHTPTSQVREDLNKLQTKYLEPMPILCLKENKTSLKQHEHCFYSDISAAGDSPSVFTEVEIEPANEIENPATELKRNHFKSLNGEEANEALVPTSTTRSQSEMMKDGEEEHKLLSPLSAVDDESPVHVKVPHSQSTASVSTVELPEMAEKFPKVSTTLIPPFTETETSMLSSEPNSISGEDKVKHGNKSALLYEERVLVLEDSHLNLHTDKSSANVTEYFKHGDSETKASDIIKEKQNYSLSSPSFPSFSSKLPSNTTQEIPDITTIPFVRSVEGLLLGDTYSKASVSLAATDNEEESTILNELNATIYFKKEGKDIILGNENSAPICSAVASTEEICLPMCILNTEPSLSQILPVLDDKSIEPLIWSSTLTVNEGSVTSENAFATEVEESQAVLSIMEVEISTPLSVTLIEQGPLILNANTDILTSACTVDTKTNTVVEKDDIPYLNDNSTLKNNESVVATEDFGFSKDETKITSMSVPFEIAAENLCLKETETDHPIPAWLDDFFTEANPVIVDATDELLKRTSMEPSVAPCTTTVEECESDDSLSLFYDATENSHTPSKDSGLVTEARETPILYKEQTVETLADQNEERQMSSKEIWECRPSSASTDNPEGATDVVKTIHKKASPLESVEEGTLFINEIDTLPLICSSRLCGQENTTIEKVAARELGAYSLLIQSEDAIVDRQPSIEHLALEQCNLEFHTSMSNAQHEKWSMVLNEIDFESVIPATEDEDGKHTISTAQANIQSTINTSPTGLYQCPETRKSEHVEHVRNLPQNIDKNSVIEGQTHNHMASVASDEQSEMDLGEAHFEDIIEIDLHKNSGDEKATSLNVADIEISRDLLSSYVDHPNVPSEAMRSHYESAVDVDKNADICEFGICFWDTQIHNGKGMSASVSRSERSEWQREAHFCSSETSQVRQTINKGGIDSHECKNGPNVVQTTYIVDSEHDITIVGTRTSDEDTGCSRFLLKDEIPKYELVDVLGLSDDGNLKDRSYSISATCNEPEIVDSINSPLNFRCPEQAHNYSDSLDLLQCVNLNSLTTVNSQPYLENDAVAQQIKLESYTALHQSSEYDQIEFRTSKDETLITNLRDPFENHAPIIVENPEDKLAYNPWTTPLICSTADCSPIRRKQPEEIEDKIACNPWSTAVIEENCTYGTSGFEIQTNNSIQTLLLIDTGDISVQTQESCDEDLETHILVSGPHSEMTSTTKDIISEGVYKGSHVHIQDVNIQTYDSPSLSLETVGKYNGVAYKEKECRWSTSTTVQIAAETTSDTDKIHCEVQHTAPEDCHRIKLVEMNDDGLHSMISASTSEEFINQEFIRDLDELRYIKQSKDSVSLCEGNLSENQSVECKVYRSDHKVQGADKIKDNSSDALFSESAVKKNKDETEETDIDIFSLDETSTEKQVQGVGSNVELDLLADCEKQDQGTLSENGVEQGGNYGKSSGKQTSTKTDNSISHKASEHISSINSYSKTQKMVYSSEKQVNNISSEFTMTGNEVHIIENTGGCLECVASIGKVTPEITSEINDVTQKGFSSNLDEAKKHIPHTHKYQTPNITNTNAALNTCIIEDKNRKIGKDYSEVKLSPFEDVKTIVLPGSPIANDISPPINEELSGSIIEISFESEENSIEICQSSVTKSIEQFYKDQEDADLMSYEVQNKNDNFSSDEVAPALIKCITAVNNDTTTTTRSALNGHVCDVFLENNGAFATFEQSNEINNLSCSQNNGALDFLTAKATINDVSVRNDTVKYTECEKTAVNKMFQYDEPQIETNINLSEAQISTGFSEGTPEGNIYDSKNICSYPEATEIASSQDNVATFEGIPNTGQFEEELSTTPYHTKADFLIISKQLETHTAPTINVADVLNVIKERNLEDSGFTHLMGKEADIHSSRQNKDHASEPAINWHYPIAETSEETNKCVVVNNTEESNTYKDETIKGKMDIFETNEIDISQTNWDDALSPSKDLTPKSENTLECSSSSENKKGYVSNMENEIKVLASSTESDRDKERRESSFINEFSVSFNSLKAFGPTKGDGMITEMISNEEYPDTELLCETRAQQSTGAHIGSVQHNWIDNPYFSCRESAHVGSVQNDWIDTPYFASRESVHIDSVQHDWIDTPYFASREALSVDDGHCTSKYSNADTQSAHSAVYDLRNCIEIEPKSLEELTPETFRDVGEVIIVPPSRTPEEVRLLDATLIDIENSTGLCNELDNGLNSTGAREGELGQENEHLELSLDKLQSGNEIFKPDERKSNFFLPPPSRSSTLEFNNPLILNESFIAARDGENSVCNELHLTSFETFGSTSEEGHEACFVEATIACAILDTQPCNSVFASRCPLLAPEDGPVLASSPSQYNVEEGTSSFPDLDDLLSKDFTTYMSSSGDQFHLWPSDVAFGSPASNLDENIDFDSVLAAPNLEEALRKLEHDIQKRKEEHISDSTPEEKSEGEIPDDKSVSADVENEDLSLSPSIAWNGGDNNLVEEVDLVEEIDLEEANLAEVNLEEEENMPDQANGQAEEENLSYDIGDSDYVSLDDMQSSFKHSPESRDTDDSRNDSSYSAGQGEGEQDGTASCRNRKLRSFEYSLEEREFRHMQGGSNAVISGFMGPAEREIWGILDGNGDDKDKPRECVVNLEEVHSDIVSTEKQEISETDDHYDKYDQDSDDNEEEGSDIDWVAVLSNVRCYPRVLSPGSGPSMSAIEEENEEDSSATHSLTVQLSSTQVGGSDGDMTNTVSETREDITLSIHMDSQEAKEDTFISETDVVPELITHCNVQVSSTKENHRSRVETSNKEALQLVMTEGTDCIKEMTTDTINESCDVITNDTVTSKNIKEYFPLRKIDDLNNPNSMRLALPSLKFEMENETDSNTHNVKTSADVRKSILSKPLELHGKQALTVNKCSPNNDMQRDTTTFGELIPDANEYASQNCDVVGIKNTNNGHFPQPLSVDLTKSKVQALKSLFEKDCSAISANEKTNESNEHKKSILFEKERVKPKSEAEVGCLNSENKVSTSENLISPKLVLQSITVPARDSEEAGQFEDQTKGKWKVDANEYLNSGNNEPNNQQIYENHFENTYSNLNQQSNTPGNTTYIAQRIILENEVESCTAETGFTGSDVNSTDIKASVEGWKELQTETHPQGSSISPLEACDCILEVERPMLCTPHSEEIIPSEIPKALSNTTINSGNKGLTQNTHDSQSSTLSLDIMTPEMKAVEILYQEHVSTETFASTVDEIFSEILELDIKDSFDSAEDPQSIINVHSPDSAAGANTYANSADHISDNNRQARREISENMSQAFIPRRPIITVTEPVNETLDEYTQLEGITDNLFVTTSSETQLTAAFTCIARRRQYWDDILRLAIEQKETEDRDKGSPQGIQKSPGLTHSEIYRKLCKRNKFAALRSRKPVSVRVHGIVNKWRLAFETLKFLEETDNQSAQKTERQTGSNVVEHWKKYWDNLVEEQAQIARYKELSKEEITKQYKAGEKRTLQVTGIVAVGRERFEKISSETVEKKCKDSIRKRRSRRLERNINSASPSPERNSRTNQIINAQHDSKSCVLPSPPEVANTDATTMFRSGSPEVANTDATTMFHFNQNIAPDIRLSPEQVPSSFGEEEATKTTNYNNLTFRATITDFEKEEISDLPEENVLEIQDKPSSTILLNKGSSFDSCKLEEESNGHTSTLTPGMKETFTVEKKSIEKDPETKNRFKKAKQFFQMLEQNATSKDSSPAPRHRTSGYRKGKTNIAPSNSREVWGSTVSLVEPRASRHNVEFPDLRPSSVNSAPAYETNWGSIQSLEDKETYENKACKGLRSSPSSSTESLSRCLPFKKLRAPAGGSERCAKVYEKFHVEDLFKDVVGEYGRNCGSLKGIPHKHAVLASLQSVGDRCLSPYDEVGSAATSDDEQPYERSMATSPLPQGYLPEYPYLSTTPARLYRPRSSLVGSSLISRKDLLNVDKTIES